MFHFRPLYFLSHVREVLSPQTYRDCHGTTSVPWHSMFTGLSLNPGVAYFAGSFVNDAFLNLSSSYHDFTPTIIMALCQFFCCQIDYKFLFLLSYDVSILKVLLKHESHCGLSIPFHHHATVNTLSFPSSSAACSQNRWKRDITYFRSQKISFDMVPPLFPWITFYFVFNFFV